MPTVRDPRQRSAALGEREGLDQAGEGPSGFVAPRDPVMLLVQKHALQVAASDETVLLLGETGVGKDVMARLIHQASPRTRQRFVQINCAALPDGLLESELFGHMRGAYTGAVDSQPGQIELAAGGTLFLDEIGELSPRLQAKLLHLLQEKVFCRVGGREPLRMDVRFIAATNQDMDRALADGSFRRDLYYRLSVISLKIPPLRDRPCDIEGLARFFALKYSSIYNRTPLAQVGEEVIDAITRYPFAGNIRELENLIKRAILLGGYDVILDEVQRRLGAAPALGPIPAAETLPAAGPVPPLKEVTRRAVAEAERAAIVRALSVTRWNRARAARLLSISYRSLLYKIAEYAILPQVAAPSSLLNEPGFGTDPADSPA